VSTVNTNVGALLAQKFLRSTSSEMVTTQSRVSSGLRVSTVTDDASSFAVAAGIRGDIKA
jgi:flagellin